eukprot:269276-Rhodomonas_salina.3
MALRLHAATYPTPGQLRCQPVHLVWDVRYQQRYWFAMCYEVSQGRVVLLVHWDVFGTAQASAPTYALCSVRSPLIDLPLPASAPQTVKRGCSKPETPEIRGSLKRSRYARSEVTCKSGSNTHSLTLRFSPTLQLCFPAQNCLENARFDVGVHWRLHWQVQRSMLPLRLSTQAEELSDKLADIMAALQQGHLDPKVPSAPI